MAARLNAQQRLEASYDYAVEKYKEFPGQHEKVAGLLAQEAARRRNSDDLPRLEPVYTNTLTAWWQGGMLRAKRGAAKRGDLAQNVVRPPIRQLVKEYMASQDRAITEEVVGVRRLVRKAATSNGRQALHVLGWQQNFIIVLANAMLDRRDKDTNQLLPGLDSIAKRMLEELADSLASSTKMKPEERYDWVMRLLRLKRGMIEIQMLIQDAETRVMGVSRGQLLNEAPQVDGEDVVAGSAGTTPNSSVDELSGEDTLRMLQDMQRAVQGVLAIRDAVEADVASDPLPT